MDRIKVVHDDQIFLDLKFYLEHGIYQSILVTLRHRILSPEIINLTCF